MAPLSFRSGAMRARPGARPRHRSIPFFNENNARLSSVCCAHHRLRRRRRSRRLGRATSRRAGGLHHAWAIVKTGLSPRGISWAGMTKSVKSLLHREVASRDGTAGSLVDLYFDDGDWCLRYLVVDPGGPMPRRELLVPA